MKLRLFCLLFLAVVLTSGTVLADVTRVSVESIGSDTVWSGTVVVEKPLKVGKGITLKVKPGATVRFKKGSGLDVEGVLKAVGSKGAPVTFTSDEAAPAHGDWSGINFIEAGDGSALKYCRIMYASAVSMAVCSPPVENCEILKGDKGLVLARKSSPVIKGNVIREMGGGGILCQMGSAPVITGNTLERCIPDGVNSGQDSQPVIKGNTFTGCDTGLTLNQRVPPVENNTFKGNKGGIIIVNSGEGLVIRGNRMLENEVGIVCQQFSKPVIEKNEISRNKQGIVCFRAASPLIRNNNIASNDEGISCIQICTPVITANNIHDNKKGVYLDLSSYALINGNNIYANTVQLELGNMSSDWERRVNNKPTRGGQAQNLTMAGRGKAVAQQVGDTAEIMGYVDATGNWWGDSGTQEMESKGQDADIKGFIDYYDVPTRTYEGYSGIYVQDKIKYAGWKKSRIKEAGL